MRVGNGGDGSMSDGDSSELIRQQHRTFDVNVSVDKARHDVGLGVIDRFVMTNDLLNHTIGNRDCGRVGLAGVNIDQIVRYRKFHAL